MPEGQAIGLSAIDTECPLRQVKIVHYNVNVAPRIPRRQATQPRRTLAASRRLKAL